MSNPWKKIIVIILFLSIIFSFFLVYLFNSKENLYIKDFELVAEDYSKITDILFEYYNKENCSETIILDIDKSKFEIIDNTEKINMDDEEKNSLKKICKTAYKGYYDFIWVTENYIIFWQDETKNYGVIYTKDYKEAKKEIEKWYAGVNFRKIKTGWYELGHFGI